VHRIALRCLVHDRGRLAVALTGVAVATLLMLVQVGIYFGFADAASAPIRRIGGDVWVMSSENKQLDHSPVLAVGTDAIVRGHPCVRSVRAAIFQFTVFRDAAGRLDSLELVGVDPGDGAPPVPWSLARGLPGDLGPTGRVTIDARDAQAIVGRRDPLGARLEIASGAARVGALSRGLRGNFGIHPIAFGTARTVRELTGMGPRQSTYWVVDLEHADCAVPVAASISKVPGLRAERTNDFAVRIERQLLETSGIGIALGVVAALGFAVAAVVVAQTLLASLRQHRRELAMLKALGARPLELVAFVGAQVAVLAGVGTSLGVAIALLLRRTLSGLSIPVVLPGSAIAAGAATVALLCALASLGSVRVVLRLEADEVLR